MSNIFKPIKELRTDAIFLVDDDVIVPCHALDLAFSLWQSFSLNMVGFVSHLHLLNQQKNGVANYKYGGWWTVRWMGSYSMVLSKAAFYHKKYMDLYTYNMYSSIRDYVCRERERGIYIFLGSVKFLHDLFP